MNIHESAEDYLEAILILRERQGMVRSIDVVHHLEVTKPSVSVAMKRFRENGYIEMDGDGYIIAGESCRTSADGVYAAGDVRAKAFRQVITAACDGANAVMDIERRLLG